MKNNIEVGIGAGADKDANQSGIPHVRPYTSVGDAQASGDGANGITLGKVWESVRHWWKWALPAGLVLAVASAGVVYFAFQPKYRAGALLQITPNAYIAYPDSAREESTRFAQTQIETIRSSIVLTPALGDVRIATLPELQAQDSKVDWLGKELSVASVGGSDLYKVQFESTDPRHAADIVNAVVDAYLAHQGENDYQRKQKVILLLDLERSARESDVKRLRSAYRDLAIKKTGTDPFTLGLTNDRDQSKSPVSDLRTRLTAVEVDCKILEAKIKAYEEITSQDNADITDHEIDAEVDRVLEVQGRKQLIASIVAKMNEIKKNTVLKEKDSEYVIWEKRREQEQKALDDLRKEHRTEFKQSMENNQRNIRRRDLSQLKAELRFKELERGLLEDKHRSQIADAKKLGGDSVDLEVAKSELAREERVFELIAQRTLGLKTEVAAGPLRVELRQPATPPVAPLERLPYKMLVLSVAGCLVLPFAAAFVWDRKVRRISSSSQLRQHMGSSLVTEIALLPSKSVRGGSNSLSSSRGMTLFEESVDSLRTCLALSDESKSARVFAITSAVSGEGKTSLSVQFAASLARTYRKPTLLIDADLRSPSIYQFLRIDNSPGLAEVLAGEANIDSAIVRVQESSLHVLPAGQTSVTPHVLVSGDELPNLLAHLRERFDYIVIDTPPVLYASETLVLAKLSDGAVFCTLHGTSRESPLKVASERLMAAGVRHLATVINGTPGSRYANKYLDSWTAVNQD